MKVAEKCNPGTIAAVCAHLCNEYACSQAAVVALVRMQGADKSYIDAIVAMGARARHQIEYDFVRHVAVETLAVKFPGFH